MSAPDTGVRPLERARGDELLAINQACPIEADFTFLFERGPDFFAWPDAVFDHHRYVGFHLGDRLVGYCMAGKTRGRIGGAPGPYFYMGDARVLPEARGNGLTHLFFDAIAPYLEDQWIGFGLIKRGNLPAERIRETAASERFVGEHLCTLDATNLILLRPAPPPSGCTVRSAREEDLEAAAELIARANGGRLFAPTPDAAELSRQLAERPGMSLERFYLAERRGELVGAVAVWDMHTLKRTVLLRYSLRGQLLRAAYGLGRLWLRSAAPLPGRGQAFKAGTLVHLAVEGRDPAIGRDLLAAAANDALAAGYHLLHVGFAEGDPLAAATRGFLCQHFRSEVTCAIDRTRGPLAGIPGSSDPYIDLTVI